MEDVRQKCEDLGCEAVRAEKMPQINLSGIPDQHALPQALLVVASHALKGQ